jgi:hypothetical protein
MDEPHPFVKRECLGVVGPDHQAKIIRTVSSKTPQQFVHQNTSDALSLIFSEYRDGVNLGRRRSPKPADAVACDSTAHRCNQEKIRKLARVENEQIFRPGVRLERFLLKHAKAVQVPGLKSADRYGERG